VPLLEGFRRLGEDVWQRHAAQYTGYTGLWIGVYRTAHSCQ